VRVRLRAARPGDELPVAELHVRSWQEAYAELMPAEFLAGLDPRERARRYSFGVGDGGPRTVLAVVGEAIAGFVTFGESRDRDAEGLGEVYALYVDPARHQAGVGRLLMAEARRQMAADGFREAILWVLQGNDRARGFYEREGWSPDGTSRVEQPYDIVSTVHRFRRGRE
jgi:ribosomal protein S18 acetylase RimI-like enzyme